MNRAQWKDLLEGTGLMAIIGSLIFVGLQIRQDSMIAGIQDAADFNDTMIEYARIINDNRDIWIKGLEGGELSSSDKITFEAVAFSVWQKFSGLYTRNELLNSGSEEGVARQLAGELFIYPGLRNYIIGRCKHRESMGQYISFCDDVRVQLERFDNGTWPKPEGQFYVF